MVTLFTRFREFVFVGSGVGELFVNVDHETFLIFKEAGPVTR